MSISLRLLILLVSFIWFFSLPVSGQQFKINTGSFFVINGSATIRINNADLVNNGTYTKGTETITISGTTASTISGSSNTVLNNLSIINTNGVTTQLGLLTVNNLTVDAGSKFTIDPAKAVTVTGITLNSAGNGGLVIKSDVTGTASLIHNSNNVPATVQRFISGAPEAWHFLSSPVANQNINENQGLAGSWLPSGTYGNGTGYDLYLWNEPNNCWIYKLNTSTLVNWTTVHPGVNFGIGRGYLYSLQALNSTKTFAGNLNNETVTYSLDFSSSDAALQGFNLAGNPYSSSIDWLATSGWTRTDLIASGGGYDMWVWDPTALNYGICNSFTGLTTNGVTRFLAPAQGYFVRASVAGNLSTDNSIRVHNTAGSWLKKGSGSEINTVSLTVTSEAGYGSDEVQMLFGQKMNENGSAKLFSPVPSAPGLFLPYQDEKLSVRYLTDTIEYPSVPVMFKSGLNGNFLIKCSFDKYNFETVLLEDKILQIFQDMKELYEYSFSAKNNDVSDRFVLHFSPVRNNSENSTLQAEVYIESDQLIVDVSGVLRETDLLIYNTMGILLYKQKLQAETRHSVSLNSSSTMLIVLLRNQDGTYYKKIVWPAK